MDLFVFQYSFVFETIGGNAVGQHDVIIKCPKCKKQFSHNDLSCEWTRLWRKRGKEKGKTCKCGNLWVGPTFIKDSRYPFYVTIQCKNKSAEIFETLKEKKNARTA
jgi:hypothetical protein